MKSHLTNRSCTLTFWTKRYKLNIKSTYTLDCIKNGISYKDYKFEYDNLNNAEKEKIVSLLRN